MSQYNPEVFFDTLSVGVQIISNDMKYIYLNKKLLAEVNKTKDEIFDKKMEEVFPGIEQTQIYSAIKECFDTQETGIFINEFTLPNHKTTFYKLRLEKINVGVLIFSEDITDEKKAKIFLEKTNLRLEKEIADKTAEANLFLDKVSDIGIIFLDPQGKITKFSHGAELISGYKATEVLGKDLNFFYPQSEKDKGYPEVELKEAEASGRFEYQGVRKRKDGSTFEASIIVNSIKDATGNLKGFSKFTKDITEETKKEKALQESNKKFRILFENSPDAYLIMELEGGKIAECNKAAEQILRATKQEIIGTTPDQLSPEYQENGKLSEELVSDRIQSVLDKGFHRFMWLHKRFDGEVFPCDVNISLIDYEERKALLVGWRDMSEYVNLRKQLETEKEKAIRNAEFKTHFLARMSHDIRTPLNSITGMIDILGETKLDNDQKSYIKTLEYSSKGMLDLVNDILDLSKIEAGELGFLSKEFNFEDCLVGAVDVISVQARKKGNNIYITKFPILDSYIEGDELRLKQVLINILGNAAKFTENGTITVEVDIKESKLQIAVKDTGIGIAEDKLSSVFDAYKQAEYTTSKKYGGSGLGLAISKSLLDLMKGDIRVESQLGKGSSFTFTIPLVLGKKIARKHSLTNALENKSILFLLDSDIENNNLSQAIESSGATAFFSSLKSFESDLTKYPLNAYVFDCDHSEQDLFNLLQKHPKLIPFTLLLLASGKYSKSAVERAKKLGIQSVLIRPFSRHTLVNILQQVCQGKAPKKAKHQLLDKKSINLKDIRVLIVDDVPTNRDVLDAFLKGTKAVVTMAENGKEAFEIFKEKEFDIIFMDMFMPVMDGINATIQMRKWEIENEKTHTPILALTANAFDTDSKEMLSAGCDAFLSKPIHKPDFLSKIQEYTEDHNKKTK